MSKNILLVGGGGHCKAVLDSLLKMNEFDEIGIIDKNNVGSMLMGVPIIGDDDDLANLFKKGYKYAFVTLGSIGKPHIRIRLFKILTEIGFMIPSIIDPSSNVSDHAKIENGVYIGKLSVVNAGTQIRKGSIVNSGSIIEHDCEIGEFVHIAPGSVLGGGVRVGDCTHIGLNSTVKQQVAIGSGTIIGMGSVVLRNITEGVLAYGNPCKEVKLL